MPRGQRAVATVPDPVEIETPVDASTLSPERQRLADAIAAVAALEADIAAVSKLVSEADQSRSVAYGKRSQAERTLERSKPRSEPASPQRYQPAGAYWGSQEAYDTHVAEEAIAPIPIGEARAALAAATDEYDSAVRAEQFHKDRLKNLQETLRWKRGNIGDAIRPVLRSEPALLALADEARRLGTRARAAVYAFQNAVGGDIIQPGSPYYGYDKPANSVREDPKGWALARAWAEALEGLKTDPATPLPMPETFS